MQPDKPVIPEAGERGVLSPTGNPPRNTGELKKTLLGEDIVLELNVSSSTVIESMEVL